MSKRNALRVLKSRRLLEIRERQVAFDPNRTHKRAAKRRTLAARP